MGKKHEQGHHRTGKWDFVGSARARERREAAARTFDGFKDVNRACTEYLRKNDRWWREKWSMEYGRNVPAER